MKQLFIVPFLLISGIAIAQKISYSDQVRERDYRTVQSDFSKFLLYYAWRSENNSFMPAYLALNDENQIVELPKPVVTDELKDTRITIDTVFQLADNLVECYSRLGDDAVKDQYFILRDRNYDPVASVILPANTARTWIVSDAGGFYVAFKIKNQSIRIVRIDNNLRLKSDLEIDLNGFKNPYLQTFASSSDNSLILAFTETLAGRAYLHSENPYFEKIFRIRPDGKVGSFEVEKLPGIRIQQQFLSYDPKDDTYSLSEIVGAREEGKSGTPNNVLNVYRWNFSGKTLERRSEQIVLPESSDGDAHGELHFTDCWTTELSPGNRVIITSVFRADRDKFKRARLALKLENGAVVQKKIIPDSSGQVIGGKRPFSADQAVLRFASVKRAGPVGVQLQVSTIDLETFDSKTQDIDITLDRRFVPGNFMASSGPDCLVMLYHVAGGHDAVFVVLDFTED